LNRFDPHFLKIWWDFIYGGMYRRGVLDDKTRTLVMIGNCVAVDEMIQTENHINGALDLGATPREILEVLFQSTAYVGMPRPLKGVDILERILERQGRICELNETATPIPDTVKPRRRRK
jgi:alkylhydroperoxidase/carboxymuconolactone decarboxylase family protein YurZ